jgi:phytoene synthase
MSGNGAVTASMAALQSDIAAKVQASGTSFYSAMRLLPQVRRDAMFAIYAFCREVDDIADEPADVADKKRRLEGWRGEIAKLYDGSPQNPIAKALLPCVKQFNLRREDFLAVIDGMEMDAEQDVRAPDWATLDLYCDRVASAVGRLSVRVFGMEEVEGIALAHHLGRALQLTNILRDIDEDAGIGRLYLPREELTKAGIGSTDPQTVAASGRLAQVCEAVAARARSHFQEADVILARNPRRVVKAPRIMEEVYRTILHGMTERGWAPPRTRVRVSGLRLSWIAVQYAII